MRTGVTAIHPRGRADPGTACAAGFSSLNGNGEMTGTVWIEESGALSLPVTITNTHAVGIAHEATIAWITARHPQLTDVWALPVAAETWDGYLNDINGRHVTSETVFSALDGARGGGVEEGSVGGGTGMNCYHFKGGSGTASRVVDHGSDRFAVGVFVQANFGARGELVIAGVPVGRELADDDPMADPSWPAPAGAGSVIAIVATDAPHAPGPVQGARAARAARPRTHRHDRVALLGRHLPRVLDGQPRARSRSGSAAAATATDRCASSRGRAWTGSSRPSCRPPRRPFSTRSARPRR